MSSESCLEESLEYSYQEMFMKLVIPLSDRQIKVLNVINFADNKIIFTLYRMLKEIKNPLTSDEILLFKAIDQNDFVSAIQILKQIYESVLHDPECDSEFEKKIEEALSGNTNKVIELFLEWIQPQNPKLRLFGKDLAFGGLLLNRKYDNSIIEILKRGNTNSLKFLIELGYDMLREFSILDKYNDITETYAFKVFLDANITDEKRDFCIFLYEHIKNQNHDLNKELYDYALSIFIERMDPVIFFKELNFYERKSLLMISESFSQYKSNENPHILKYMFNKMIVMEVSSFYWTESLKC